MKSNVDTAERLIADEDELLIRVPKGMKRTHIDKTLNRIFKKHIEFEHEQKRVSFNCDHCKVQFQSSQAKQYHEMTKHSSSSFSCTSDFPSAFGGNIKSPLAAAKLGSLELI